LAKAESNLVPALRSPRRFAPRDDAQGCRWNRTSGRGDPAPTALRSGVAIETFLSHPPPCAEDPKINSICKDFSKMLNHPDKPGDDWVPRMSPFKEGAKPPTKRRARSAEASHRPFKRRRGARSVEAARLRLPKSKALAESNLLPAFESGVVGMVREEMDRRGGPLCPPGFGCVRGILGNNGGLPLRTTRFISTSGLDPLRQRSNGGAASSAPTILCRSAYGHTRLFLFPRPSEPPAGKTLLFPSPPSIPSLAPPRGPVWRGWSGA
jgi:hypothetical protein